MNDVITPLGTPLDIYREKIGDAVLRYAVTVQDGNLYFRYDTEDSDSKTNWTLFCEFQEILRDKGYEIKDPCIEHDRISGDLAAWAGN